MGNARKDHGVASELREAEMDEPAATQVADFGVAKGFDRRTLLTGASRLALMAVAGGPLWELIASGPQGARDSWVDSTYWTDGTGWTDA